jgi:8-oxo-dGTP pyrophosphatase MutT (NUDIX family)
LFSASESKKKLFAKMTTMIHDVDQVMEELAVRFILNCPSEEYSSFERLCFLVEEAHWFYLDFFCEQDESLPPLPQLVHFAKRLFKACPPLRRYVKRAPDIFSEWREYKLRVPVCGAVLLNETLDKVLLVKGWNARSSWGFPRGKINKNESEADCAAREVFEETSFDCSPLIDEDDTLYAQLGQQNCRLFVIPYVSESTPFAPRTRKEISAIEWHFIDTLPGSSAAGQRAQVGGNFFLVAPFVKLLERWIQSHVNSPDAIERRREQHRLYVEHEASAPAAPLPASSGSLLVSHSEPAIRSALASTHASHDHHDRHHQQQHRHSQQLVARPPRIERPVPSLLRFEFDRQSIMACFQSSS